MDKPYPFQGAPILSAHQKKAVHPQFLLEIHDKKFTEKMNTFFDSIKDKLPCSYDDIFDGEENQIKVFEYFVYLLHLLQLDKIKYEKNTNTLYL